MIPEIAPLGDHFILFRQIPLIYARVPKVANTSIKAALAGLLQPPLAPDPDVITADSTWRRGTDGRTTMVNASDARRRRSSHFIFSFVRNPYDRLVSAYNNKLIANDHLSPAMQKMGLMRFMPFDHFLEVIAATPDHELDIHLLPQSRILCLDHQPIPNFIGKIEAMSSHWKLLRKRMGQAGLPGIGELPSENVRRKQNNDLSAYLNTRRSIELAATRYKDDFDYFYPQQDHERLARGEHSGSHPVIEQAGANPLACQKWAQPP